MKVIRRADDARLTELARGIVRKDYLIVDNDPSWRTSLALIAGGFGQARNLGMILVPVAPHLGGYWINGVAPGVTLECVLVAKGDMPALKRKVDAMNAALFPEPQ